MTWRFLTWVLGDVVPSTERKIRRMITDLRGVGQREGECVRFGWEKFEVLFSVKRTLFTRWIPNISSSVGLLHKGEQIIKYIRFRQRLKTADANLNGI